MGRGLGNRRMHDPQRQKPAGGRVKVTNTSFLLLYLLMKAPTLLKWNTVRNECPYPRT